MNTVWENMPEATLEQIRTIKESLVMTERNVPRQTVENCTIVLDNDPFLEGAFCLNLLTERMDIVKGLGWSRDGDAFTDSDLSHLLLYMEKFYGLTSEKCILHALDVVARRHQYHPIRDYLNSLKWDGEERIRYALRHFLGGDTDDLTYESFKIFLLGAVNRVFHPGCKFEIMFCLVGGQGAGKSSFVRLLALKNEWFTDDLKKLDDENVYRKIASHWIIEMAEMLGTASAKSVDEIKAFLSKMKETYKTPYAKYPKDRPRQCVFVGTSNIIPFLPLDRTGNRRFFPNLMHPEKAEVHILDDIEASTEYIRQLWAEVMVIYRSGNYSLTLSPELERQMDIRRQSFMAEDTLTGEIQEWLNRCNEDYVCTKMIYNQALRMNGEPDRKSISMINDVMNNTICGWLPGPSSHRFGGKYGTQRAWHRATYGELNPDMPPDDPLRDFSPLPADCDQLTLSDL